MIEIKEVTTRRQQRQFVDFPTKLYRKNPYYVHPLRMDELNLFNEKNVSYEDVDAVYYLAYKDGKIVGRIAGLIQRLYNQKVNEKRVRFTRFDCIDDEKVARALFTAVERWGKNKGMDIIHGPMGFNDLDREGMLIEGFDELATFEEQYNYAYYPKLMEACGYEKEVDWLEYKIYPTEENEERVNRLSEAVLKRYKLRIATAKNKKEYIEKYKQGIFEIIDEAYGDLYGTVPFTDKVRDQIISQFKLFLSMKFLITLVNENDEVVAFGLAIPSLSKAIQKSKGRITPLAVFRVVHAVKHPKICDFGLIGVRKTYANRGLPAVMMNWIMTQMKDCNLDYCETNLNLEYNIHIQNQWKNFKHEQHKRRRSYVKNI